MLRPRALAKVRVGAALMVLAAVVAGCGNDGDGAGVEIQGAGETVRSGKAAAALVVEPDVAKAPGRAEYSVINEGEGALTHGVCPGFERLDGGEWVDATEEIVGSSNQACIAIAAGVAPGETGGPHPIRIASGAGGTYRAVLEVTDPAGNALTLRDAFEVSPA